jgi:hypothetical protein
MTKGRADAPKISAKAIELIDAVLRSVAVDEDWGLKDYGDAVDAMVALHEYIASLESRRTHNAKSTKRGARHD